MAAEGGDPSHDAVFAVFNCGTEAALHLPETAPAWELMLDTTQPGHAPSGKASDLTSAPARSVLLFRSLAGNPKGVTP